MKHKIWHHFLYDPEVLRERERDEREELFLQWEYQEKWEATDDEREAA